MIDCLSNGFLNLAYIVASEDWRALPLGPSGKGASREHEKRIWPISINMTRGV
jgi:hypothetical protein